MNAYNVLYLVEGVMYLVRRPMPKIAAYLVGTSLLFHLPKWLGNKSILSVYEYGLLPILVYKKNFVSITVLSSTFVHHTPFHFFADSLNLLQVCSFLERAMPSGEFLKCLLYSSVVPNIILTILTKFGSKHRDYAGLYRSLYYGQTGQVFCLSTILNLGYLSRMQAYTSFYGMAVPSSWSIWLELILNQLLNPSPVVAHASGLVSGLLYVYGNPRLPGLDLDFGFFAEVRRLRSRMMRWLGYNNLHGARSRRDYSNSNNNANIHRDMQTNLSREELRRRRLERFS